MKKILFTALIAIATISSAFATDNKVINATIRTAFETDFRRATDVTWQMKASFAQVDFVMDGKKLAAFYTPDGALIGSSQGVSLEQLPTRAKRVLAKKLEGYNVTEALKFSFPDEDAYFVSAEKDQHTVVVKISEAGDYTLVQR